VIDDEVCNDTHAAVSRFVHESYEVATRAVAYTIMTRDVVAIITVW
jgi:hypothetical protein